MKSIVEILRPAGFDCFSNLDMWKSWRDEKQSVLTARWIMAQQLYGALDGAAYNGWCELCSAPTEFRISEKSFQGTSWNFRGDAKCNSCGMMARLRFCALLLRHLLIPTDSAIYVNEQLSDVYAWLLRNYKDVVGSEYVPDRTQRRQLQKMLDRRLRGQGRQKIIHEDATALSFHDGRFRALMSFDVLEHIPDYHAALREFARVLQPGGVAILTAPFLDKDQQTRIRARHLADGTLEHILPPEYHGDPVAEDNKVLCYQEFGWDILEAMRSAGFREAWTVFHWDLAGGFPTGLTAWVAQR